MGNKDINCLFCDDENIKKRYIYKNDYLMSFPTNIPITLGHILICPTRHIVKIDDLSDSEIIAIKNFIVKLKKFLIKAFNAEGFNIAWNEGESAGQVVEHLHIYIIPRKKEILEYINMSQENFYIVPEIEKKQKKMN